MQPEIVTQTATPTAPGDTLYGREVGNVIYLTQMAINQMREMAASAEEAVRCRDYKEEYAPAIAVAREMPTVAALLDVYLDKWNAALPPGYMEPDLPA